MTPNPPRINLTFECLCGDIWTGPLPRKFQTREFAQRELARWEARHTDGKQPHIYTVTNEA